MNSSVKNLNSLFNDNIYIDEEIQRTYEWGEKEIKNSVFNIIESTQQLKEDHSVYDCKRDIGSIIRFKIPESDYRYNVKKNGWFVDEGYQRLTTSVIHIKALYDLSVEFEKLYGEEITEAKIVLKSLLKKINENFIPQKDLNEFKKIVIG